MKKLHQMKLKAMTLTELLVVLAIIGILILMAYPLFTGIITDTHYKEAELNLKSVSNFQQAYFMEHAKYSDNLKEINFIQNKLASEGGNAHFRIEVVSASNTNFKALATAVTDFDSDGTFAVWEIDKEGTPKMVTED